MTLTKQDVDRLVDGLSDRSLAKAEWNERGSLRKTGT